MELKRPTALESWKTSMLKMRIGIGILQHLAKDNVEMIDVLDYDYIEDAWDHPAKSVDEIVSKINDYDMVTLICRDNNYRTTCKAMGETRTQ